MPRKPNITDLWRKLRHSNPSQPGEAAAAVPASDAGGAGKRETEAEAGANLELLEKTKRRLLVYSTSTKRSSRPTQEVETAIHQIVADASSIQSQCQPSEISSLIIALESVLEAIRSSDNITALNQQAMKASGHTSSLWQALGTAMFALGAALVAVGTLSIVGTLGLGTIPGIVMTGLGGLLMGLSPGAFNHGRQQGLSKSLSTAAFWINKPKVPAKAEAAPAEPAKDGGKAAATATTLGT